MKAKTAMMVMMVMLVLGTTVGCPQQTTISDTGDSSPEANKPQVEVQPQPQPPAENNRGLVIIHLAWNEVFSDALEITAEVVLPTGETNPYGDPVAVVLSYVYDNGRVSNWATATQNGRSSLWMAVSQGLWLGVFLAENLPDPADGWSRIGDNTFILDPDAYLENSGVELRFPNLKDEGLWEVAMESEGQYWPAKFMAQNYIEVLLPE